MGAGGGRVEVQATMGFGPKFGERPRVRVVKLAVCGLFVMGDTGDGWFPVCAAADGLELARSIVGAQYPAAVVVVVSEKEVGR